MHASSGDFSTIQTELREVLDSCPSDKPDETKASLMALKQELRARHSFISKDAEKEIDKQITKASVSALQQLCKTIGNDQSKFDEALRNWLSISDKHARDEAQSFLSEVAAHNPTFTSALAGRVERMKLLNLPSPLAHHSLRQFSNFLSNPSKDPDPRAFAAWIDEFCKPQKMAYSPTQHLIDMISDYRHPYFNVALAKYTSNARRHDWLDSRAVRNALRSTGDADVYTALIDTAYIKKMRAHGSSEDCMTHEEFTRDLFWTFESMKQKFASHTDEARAAHLKQHRALMAKLANQIPEAHIHKSLSLYALRKTILTHATNLLLPDEMKIRPTSLTHLTELQLTHNLQEQRRINPPG